jgi:hypothetical protein
VTQNQPDHDPSDRRSGCFFRKNHVRGPARGRPVIVHHEGS